LNKKTNENEEEEMKRTKVFLVALAFLAFIFFSLQGAALAYNVAYVYGNTETERLNIALNFLNGNFDSVTPIDGDASTLPTLSELLAYDAVMISPNHCWTYAGRSNDLGNLLADYVDAGGGLVMTTFSWQYPDCNGLHGRLMDEGYSPFNGGYSLYSFATLTSSSIHPIMEGVNAVSGYYRDAVKLSEDAQVIATWSDGFPFVAIDNGSGVVGISLFPESYPSEIDGDYARLFINALNWAAEHKKQPNKPKHGMGWVVTIDGMDPWSSILPGWADPTTYLNDAIDTTSPKKKWRQVITEKVGPIIPYIWTRNTADTAIAVHKLYEYIKYLNSTNRPVVIISHSWGTVLICIALIVHDDIHVDKLITLGSPLESSTPGVESVTDWWLWLADISSVSKPSNLGVWHNYYTGCDIIAASIPALSSKDNYVNKKLYPSLIGCHQSYYKDENKWDKILQDVISK
jgi:hypothetical protein